MPNFERPTSLQRLLDGRGLSHPLHTANVGSWKGNAVFEAVPRKKSFSFTWCLLMRTVASACDVMGNHAIAATNVLVDSSLWCTLRLQLCLV